MVRVRTTLVRVLTASLLAGLVAQFAAGCGGSPTAPSRDEVFYLHGGGVIDQNKSWEVYFPALDRPKSERLPRYVGVGVLDGDVRLHRPVDWSIRDANYSPERRFISYQSPRQFIFSIYERVDPPQDTWTEVLRRYESDVEESGGTILSARMPTGTANAQGRTFLVKTMVAGRPPYEAYAHEVLIRSDRRVLLVQIVHDDDIESINDEMTEALQSMIVY
jgi:hypothetical protein